MKNIYQLLTVIVLMFAATGCETIKATLSGPFIGMEKDLNNLSKASTAANTKLKESIKDPNAPQSTNDQGLIKNLDTWVQKNWW